jgi:NADH-quinone oxidoreductase subunit L
LLFLLALFTAFLTAYYMTRLWVVTFFGRPRSEAAEHGHDGPLLMTGPLVVLAVLSIISAWGTGPLFEHWIEGATWPAHSIVVPILATLAFAAGLAGRLDLVYRKGTGPDPHPGLQEQVLLR